MGQAVFFINELKVHKKDGHIVLEGQQKCVHGHVIDRVFVTVPDELKYILAQAGEDHSAAKPAPVNRMGKHFRDN